MPLGRSHKKSPKVWVFTTSGKALIIAPPCSQPPPRSIPNKPPESFWPLSCPYSLRVCRNGLILPRAYVERGTPRSSRTQFSQPLRHAQAGQRRQKYWNYAAPSWHIANEYHRVD